VLRCPWERHLCYT